MTMNNMESGGDRVAYWLTQIEAGGSYRVPPDHDDAFLAAWAETHDMSRADAQKMLAELAEKPGRAQG